MSFIKKVLDPPSYGWTDNYGNLYKPSNKQIIQEFFKRTNVFKSRKNWLPFFSWISLLCFFPFFIFFIIHQSLHFNAWQLVFVFLYSMVLMGTHGTIWYHRYCTHGAYTFRNKFWKVVTQNLVIKIIPEEIYVISHHVHHAVSDMPGDPYNASGGFLYCFLADTNHQPIAKNLTEDEFHNVQKLMRHTGVKSNSYKAYLKWGSFAKPFYTILFTCLNWVFWYGVFYLIGGHHFAIAIFAGAFLWALGVRTFNYEGHGKGKDKRREGVDYNTEDMSINQIWPGFVAGEWHNNHHLYPGSARSGFLKYQIDFAWCYIKMMNVFGAVSSYHDSKKQFIENYRKPYLNNKESE
ncbi:MAG: fatty acid desaturase [Arachidicoccus sp.]|nr:fatty acid desaturase [Arachidicoccus sp.]